MLTNALQGLRDSIQWAHGRADIELYDLARQRMEDLEAVIHCLPAHMQEEVYLLVEELLPMEWPLWMEACRDNNQAAGASPTLH